MQSRFTPDDRQIPEIPEVSLGDDVEVESPAHRYRRRQFLTKLGMVTTTIVGGTTLMVLGALATRDLPPQTVPLFSDEYLPYNPSALPAGLSVSLLVTVGKLAHRAGDLQTNLPGCYVGAAVVLGTKHDHAVASFGAKARSTTTSSAIDVDLPSTGRLAEYLDARPSNIISGLTIYTLDSLPLGRPYALTYTADVDLGSDAGATQKFTVEFAGPAVTRVNDSMYKFHSPLRADDLWVFTGPEGATKSFTGPPASTLEQGLA